MKELMTRSISTVDGPSTRVVLTLLESDGVFYVSIRTGDTVHVVDAMHFHWDSLAIKEQKDFKRMRAHR